MRTRATVLLLASVLALPTTPAPASAVPSPGAPQPVTRTADPATGSVLVISVDGLSPRALTQLGRAGAPHLHRFLRQGASTRNARTVVESTSTLPNHTSMVTGRRVDASTGGHGVTWNHTAQAEAETVHRAAGEHVDSLFTTLDAAGAESAVFVGKPKFRLWQRSWGRTIDRMTVRRDDARLARAVRRDLRRHRRELRFWHVATPDRAGHRAGFRSRRYLAAVEQVDAMLGRLLRTLRRPGLRGTVTVLLTSDHGAHAGRSHDDEATRGNQRVIFAALGPGVSRGADLYALNSDHRRAPGRSQPGYDAEVPPVRNAEVANLALDLLGLPAVADSEINAAQDLVLTSP
ncbi:alkaline phosphatase family protein [Nocardioides sp. Y6]|uniref:Alkaline phosphatase family protein n=1 Tax=Nocardioides malaquae TaxID=2773426 RepID=A0ABR9RQA0_9ACTN|nr:alkaline phosphatase family protein [Nocardioides malaquae]MBE7323746.1 alkaline phosphatase family protein [Nocardioides malaquae]